MASSKFDPHAVLVAVVDAEAPWQATLGGILEQPDASARASDRASDQAQVSSRWSR
jgi:hypothetical protein